jgi:hypothetical protein
MTELTEKTKYLCVFCDKWQKIEDFDDHKLFCHNTNKFDIKRPNDYNEYRNRFEMIGMLDEK